MPELFHYMQQLVNGLTIGSTYALIFLRNLTDITGGPNGISNIEKPTFFGLTFERKAAEGMQTFHEFFGLPYNSINKVIFLYLIALLLALAALFVINRLLRMPIGRAWEALREDEIACRALGLNPTVIKLSAFTLGAASQVSRAASLPRVRV